MRRELMDHGVAARGVAFVSSDVGSDLSRLAKSDEVALLLIDGRRPLLGEGVPRGAVGEVLAKAPCDVGVLVAKEDDAVVPGPDAPVVVPFGGAEHDWAALELGAWIASANGAPLKLLGRRRRDRRAHEGHAPARRRRPARPAVRGHLGHARWWRRPVARESSRRRPGRACS